MIANNACSPSIINIPGKVLETPSLNFSVGGNLTDKPKTKVVNFMLKCVL